jgi:hypothetical protein
MLSIMSFHFDVVRSSFKRDCAYANKLPAGAEAFHVKIISDSISAHLQCNERGPIMRINAPSNVAFLHKHGRKFQWAREHVLLRSGEPTEDKRGGHAPVSL